MSTVLGYSLEGAVALVTGANGEIGGATCAALAAAGAKVVGTDLTAAPKDGVKVDLWAQHDVTSPEAWRTVIEQLHNRFGRLDCLINSAGICPLERLENTSLELWRKIFNVNLDSILIGMQAALPLLRESGAKRSGGSAIVNLASTAGIRGVALGTAYCASKGGVTLLSKSAAKEFGALKYPIRVNSVHPSSVEGPMMDLNFKRFVEMGAAPSVEVARADAAKRNVMGRMARAEDVAGGIVYLCTPAASFVNGAEFVIDGGLTA